MNIKGLRTFVSVMATGSLLSAARELNTSVSALSRQLSMLETDLGLKLFSRDNRQLTPTARAHAFLPEVERLLSGFDQIPAIVADIKRLPERRLRIGAMPRMASCVVEPAVARYMQMDPAADVVLDTRPRRRLERGLLEGKLDVAFGSIPANHHAIAVKRLYRLPAVLMVHPGHRLAGRSSVRLEDLVDDEIIALPPSTLLGRTIADLFADAGVRMRSRLQVSQVISCCSLVAQGYGIAISDTMIPEPVRSAVTLVPLQPEIHFEFGALYLEEAHDLEDVRALTGIIDQVATAFGSTERFTT